MTVRKPEREGSAEEAWLRVRERALLTGGGARAESQYSRECLRVACRPNAALLCQQGGTWEDIKSQNQVINYELRVVCFFVLFTKVKLLCLFFPKIPC